MLAMNPSVFLVENNYQIVIHATCFGIAWIEVGEKCFFDEDNGLLRSERLTHKLMIPTHILDENRSYTVCFRALPDRKPYFPQLGETQRWNYSFSPINTQNALHLCHLADTHSQTKEAITIGQNMQDRMDLLILNGDIPAESKSTGDLLAISEIISEITGGEKPVVYARGNHDLRGKHAIELTDYIGTREGSTYFTFRSGGLWGVVLDCGEDKLDSHPEYGGIVHCHVLRKRQTEFLKSILEHSMDEFAAPGVTVRLVICHIPFLTELMASDSVFDIEQDIFAEWTHLLCQMNIDLMLCGHNHALHTYYPDDKGLRYHPNFPVLVASEPCYGHEDPQQDRMVGADIEFTEDVCAADFVDNLGHRQVALRIRRSK